MSARVLPSSHGGDCGGDPPGGGGGWQPPSGCQARGPKQGRKKTKNLSLKANLKRNKNDNDLLDIEFEKGDHGTYIAVGDNSGNFNSLLGTIISRIPYHYPSWKQVPPEHTCAIYDELQTYFDVELHTDGPGGDIIKAGLDKHFSSIYKTQKCRFGKNYFEKRGGIANAAALREDPPAHVPIADWRKFVDLRCSEAFQRRSSANKGCRSKQEIIVRHGRKNLAQIRYENKGKSPIDLWRDKRIKDGDFTEDKARQLYDEMIEKKNDPTNTLSEDDIIQEVLGESRSWVREVGQKISQYAKLRASSSSCSTKQFTEADVRRMMAEYTAPLWNKLEMTQPDEDDDEEEGNEDDTDS